MDKMKWIIINYTIPSVPSRLRVGIWRKLKKLGAVNIQNSLWVLFYNGDNYSILQGLKKEIEDNNGDLFLMEATFSYIEQEKQIITRFNDLRDEEYIEFIEKTEAYHIEIQKEIRIEKFTFGELEEEEEELNKLISWYEKIKGRDIFNSSLGEEAREKLEKVKDEFENFSELVYEFNNELEDK